MRSGGESNILFQHPLFRKSLRNVFQQQKLFFFIMSSRNLEVIKKKDNRLSRRLTVDTQEPYISIRPIIKSKYIIIIVFEACLNRWFIEADKEAAYTLSEAYADNILLNWITGAIKDETKKFVIYQDIFKVLIRTAASESREFAIQMNGCKGVLLWSEGHSEVLSVGNVMGKKRLWGSLGGLATMVKLFMRFIFTH